MWGARRNDSDGSNHHGGTNQRAATFEAEHSLAYLRLQVPLVLCVI